MPTVSNRDFNGHWSERKSSVGQDALTVKRFKEGHDLNMLPSTRTSAAESIAEEHGYAVTQRFVSSNSYYGYHPVMTTGNGEDCLMDTSENTPSAGFNPDTTTCGPTGWLVSRKRSLDLEGGMDIGNDSDMTVNKRVRYDHVPDTTEAVLKSPGNSILTIGHCESEENLVALLLRGTHGCELFNFFEVD